MNKKRILVPIPSYGFDPTEVAIPWKLISESGHKIIFATPNGNKATADRLMLLGKNLGIWKAVLRARQDAVDAYTLLSKNDSFCNPIKYNNVLAKDFDALLLPGGHDKGVKEYLESTILQQAVVDFFNAKKPVAAICHGVVLVARSINVDTGKSIIYNYKTTALLKSQELLAYNMTRLWLGDYYLTYPNKTVEDEVSEALADRNDFIQGPKPIARDSKEKLSRGFCLRDRNYLSARWPGDAYNFSFELIKMLEEG